MKNPIPAPTKQTDYHLYVAWGCPFSHRILAALSLTGLKDKLGYTWMKDVKREQGWQLDDNSESNYAKTYLKELYQHLEPEGKHRPSVPLMIDLNTGKIISTDSPQMTRFVTTGMNRKYPIAQDLCPAPLRDQIDTFNIKLHDDINRGVYDVGFATEQKDYEAKVHALFAALDVLEKRLESQSYLHGETLTESDIFLYASLVRFDSVYHPLFKCSLKRITDYPNLSAYQDRLNTIEPLAETNKADLIKRHYFSSLISTVEGIRDLNPSGIVPL